MALAQKASVDPCALMLSREEVFYTITKHAAVISHEDRRQEGRHAWWRASARFISTPAPTPTIGPRVAKSPATPHAVRTGFRNLKIDSYSVYTTKPPAGAFRGFGVSQSAWAVEVADGYHRRARSRWIRLELRKRTATTRAIRSSTEETLRRDRLKECLDAAASVDWMGFEQVQQRRAKAQGVASETIRLT
mgnify:CR=1 FL=1